jgi:hypothetical protein
MRKTLLFALLLFAGTSVMAHGKSQVRLGVHFGFPVFYSSWWYAPPPVYYYPYPAVVVPPSPPVYVEKEQAENWWYYCDQSKGYYPYVKECPGGWQRVPPTPPAAK